MQDIYRIKSGRSREKSGSQDERVLVKALYITSLWRLSHRKSVIW